MNTRSRKSHMASTVPRSCDARLPRCICALLGIPITVRWTPARSVLSLALQSDGWSINWFLERVQLSLQEGLESKKIAGSNLK